MDFPQGACKLPGVKAKSSKKLTFYYLPAAGRQIPKITHIEEAVMLHQVLREMCT